MIKLVACDIDGTLLEKNQSELGDDTVHALEGLYKKGKIIALASGRTYFSMRNVAKKLSFADDIYYICCDGAICIYKEKVLYHKQISIENILRISRNTDYIGLPVLFSSHDFSYVTGSTPEFLDCLEKNGIDRLDPISGVYDVKSPIYKIGIYGDKTAPSLLLPSPFDLRVAYNRDNIVEYISRLANKGTALSDLQMRLYLSKLDTAAFGDGDNDVEMFSKAKYTFASSFGHDDLKAKAREQFHTIADALESIY